MVKRKSLKELLAERILESENEVARILNNPLSLHPAVFHQTFLTSPQITKKQALQEFGEVIEYIRSNERAKAEAAEQAEQQRYKEEREGDYVWLWDHNVPFSADLPMDLRSRLENDPVLRRLASSHEGLQGNREGDNWRRFTDILRRDYSIYSTGGTFDKKARELYDQPEYLQWKTYVEAHPDMNAQSKKLKSQRIGKSGYAPGRKYSRGRR